MFSKSEERWKDICRLAGDLYRYEFENILMVYAQRPHATLAADYDTWKKVGRFVKRGSKGIAVYPSRALREGMRYVFDISDTGGRQQQLTWQMTDENVMDYLEHLRKHKQLDYPEGVAIQGAKNIIKNFTLQRIHGIMREEFSERNSEIAQLAGTVKMVENDRESLSDETQGLAEYGILGKSILYVVGTRCHLPLSPQEQDLSGIMAVTNEEDICLLGSLVCDVSCNVLREINRDFIEMERSRVSAAGREPDKNRASADRTQGRQERRQSAYGSTHGNHIHREGGRDAVSQYRDGSTKGTETGQIRTDGDGVSSGELPGQIPDAEPVRTSAGETVRGGRTGIPDDRPVYGEISEKAPAGGQKFHDGEVAHPQAGDGDYRGNRGQGSGEPVSLGQEPADNTETAEEKETDKQTETIKSETPTEDFRAEDLEIEKRELDRELEEIHSLGRQTGGCRTK
jgi:hypothetical protein